MSDVVPDPGSPPPPSSGDDDPPARPAFQDSISDVDAAAIFRKAREEADSLGKPKLLVVSTGTVEANQAMGLTSPVVLDQDFSVGRAFGAGGTPSAVLVDAEGRIASPVAVGAQAVLALAAPLDVAPALAR